MKFVVTKRKSRGGTEQNELRRGRHDKTRQRKRSEGEIERLHLVLAFPPGNIPRQSKIRGNGRAWNNIVWDNAYVGYLADDVPNQNQIGYSLNDPY